MQYILKRALTYVVVFFVVLNLVFILPRLVPGNAAEILASGSHLPAQQVKLIEARLGLNQPLYIQYELFLKNTFLSWPPDFGYSYLYYPATVSSLFAVRVGWTLLLVISSFFLSLLLAYGAALVTALRRGGKLEFISLYSSIVLNSTPIFWVAMILLWIFAVYLGWLPLFGNVSFGVTPGTSDYYVSVITHAILPIVVLSLSLFGQAYLLLRGSIQEAIKSDYVLAAKSRGLKDRTVASSYILRNSLLPLVSILAFSTASIISRVVLIETVFGYPGIGDLILDAVGGRDYPVLEGSLFYLTIMVIIGGLIGDFVLLRLDPRLRV